MITTPSIVRAAELRSQDFLHAAARERQIDAAMATAPSTRLAVRRSSAQAAPYTVRTTARYARSLLTSLASIAFGLHLN